MAKYFSLHFAGSLTWFGDLTDLFLEIWKFSLSYSFFFFSSFSIPVMPKGQTHSKRVIVVQPFADFSSSLAENVYKQIKQLHAATILKEPIELPTQSFYSLRNRYRADTLIHFLKSIRKCWYHYHWIDQQRHQHYERKIPDWGIMGLGYCPGQACIVSTYRLSKTIYPNSFIK